MKTRHSARAAGLLAALLVLGGLAMVSLAVGARPIPLSTVADVLLSPDASDANYVVWSLRIPRTLTGVAVGAALGTAGALMQALTRNPLADPGLLGVNAGAGAMVALAISVLGVTHPAGYVWFGFAGAALAGAALYLLANGSRGGASPIRIALSGLAVSAALTGLTQAMMLINARTLDQMRFWTVGSLVKAQASTLNFVAPMLAGGVILGILLARPLNALALGDDTAASLGIRLGMTRLAGLAAITVLCGAATATVGPLIFVGLAVPHMARVIAGPDQRWMLPYCAVLAPILLLVADVAGRLVAGDELDVGVVTALLGAPVFIALVRRERLVKA